MRRPFELSGDELARRAEWDAAMVAGAGAFDSEGCDMCRAMARACANCVWLAVHPEARPALAEVDRRLALAVDASKGCEECGGAGRIFEEVRRRPVACWVCNAPPPYPGMVPGGLAETAFRVVLERGPVSVRWQPARRLPRARDQVLE